MPSSLRKRLSVAAGNISGSSSAPTLAAARSKALHHGLALGSRDVMWCCFSGHVQWAYLVGLPVGCLKHVQA